jgi:hypothetical protein
MHTSMLFIDREGGTGTGIFAGGRLPSVPTGQFGALVGASNRSKIEWSAFMIEIENPAISREVIKKPVYTLSTASPNSNCSLGTAFPAAIISSIKGVPPKLQNRKGETKFSPNNQIHRIIEPKLISQQQHLVQFKLWSK